MILCGSIIYKITVYTYRFAHLLKTNSFVQWGFPETGACEGKLWWFFNAREARE